MSKMQFIFDGFFAGLVEYILFNFTTLILDIYTLTDIIHVIFGVCGKKLESLRIIVKISKKGILRYMI